MDKIQDLNVVFAGCAKNCEKYLPKVFENINEYKKLFKSSYTLLLRMVPKIRQKYYPLTKAKLNNFFKDEFEDQPYRGKRLELARNFIIEKLEMLINIYLRSSYNS